MNIVIIASSSKLVIPAVEPLVSTQGSTAGENSGTYATSVTIMMIVDVNHLIIIFFSYCYSSSSSSSSISIVPTAAANAKTYPNRSLLRITRRHSIIGQQ